MPLKIQCRDFKDTFNCTSKCFSTKPHICSSEALCPIVKEDITNAKFMNTMKFDNLCNFAQNFIHNSESSDSSYTINVGIFGGSVTVGRDTEGCQRFSESSAYCSWVSYFSQWLKSIAPPTRKLKIFNFAVSGFDSCCGRSDCV